MSTFIINEDIIRCKKRRKKKCTVAVHCVKNVDGNRTRIDESRGAQPNNPLVHAVRRADNETKREQHRTIVLPTQCKWTENSRVPYQLLRRQDQPDRVQRKPASHMQRKKKRNKQRNAGFLNHLNKHRSPLLENLMRRYVFGTKTIPETYCGVSLFLRDNIIYTVHRMWGKMWFVGATLITSCGIMMTCRNFAAHSSDPRRFSANLLARRCSSSWLCYCSYFNPIFNSLWDLRIQFGGNCTEKCEIFANNE